MTRAQRTQHVDGPHREPGEGLSLAVIVTCSLVPGAVLVFAIYLAFGPPPSMPEGW